MRTPFGLRFPIADVERWSAKYSYVERKEGLKSKWAQLAAVAAVRSSGCGSWRPT